MNLALHLLSTLYCIFHFSLQSEAAAILVTENPSSSYELMQKYAAQAIGEQSSSTKITFQESELSHLFKNAIEIDLDSVEASHKVELIKQETKNNDNNGINFATTNLKKINPEKDQNSLSHRFCSFGCNVCGPTIFNPVSSSSFNSVGVCKPIYPKRPTHFSYNAPAGNNAVVDSKKKNSFHLIIWDEFGCKGNVKVFKFTNAKQHVCIDIRSYIKLSPLQSVSYLFI